MEETKGKHILVAEDEEPMAHALELKLTNEGFSVVVVQNGKEALSYIHTNHPDAILLDLVMPEMNGFQVLEALTKESQKPHIFVTSNLGQSEDITKAKEMGAIEYFVKSETSIKEIVQKVKQALQ